MTYVPPQYYIPDHVTGLARSFAQIVYYLNRGVAERAGFYDRHPEPAERAKHPMLCLIWARLQRLVQQILALAARAAAGTLPPPRTRPAGRAPAKRQPRPRLPALRFPRWSGLARATGAAGERADRHLLAVAAG